MLGTGAGGVAAEAAAAGAAAVVAVAGAGMAAGVAAEAGAAGLVSAEAEAAGAVGGVCAKTAAPLVNKLKPRAREASIFFIIVFSFLLAL